MKPAPRVMRPSGLARIRGRYRLHELLNAGPSISQQDAARLEDFRPRLTRISYGLRLAFHKPAVRGPSSFKPLSSQPHSPGPLEHFAGKLANPTIAAWITASQTFRAWVSGFRQVGVEVAGWILAWARYRSAAMMASWLRARTKHTQALDVHALVPLPEIKTSADPSQLEAGQASKSNRPTPSMGRSSSHPLSVVLDRSRTR